MRPEGEPRASRTHQFGDAATVNTLITELKLVLKAEGSSIPSMPGAIQPPDIHRRPPPPACLYVRLGPVPPRLLPAAQGKNANPSPQRV